MATNRPTGVTIICILGFIGAILSIIGGALLLGAGGLGITLAAYDAATLALIGGVTLIIGIILFISLFWLWKMRKIGWKIVMVLEIISLIIGIINIDVVGAIIALIIVVYLWMKRDLFK